MASPVSDSYCAGSGLAIYGGRAAPVSFSAFTEDFDSVPAPTDLGSYLSMVPNGAPIVIEMHGSSGQAYSNGLQYRANVSGRMAYPGFSQFGFSTVGGGDDTKGRFARVRPIDEFGTYPANGQKRESFFAGFWHVNGSGDNVVTLTTARNMDALMRWTLANMTQYDTTRICAYGESMGAGGCFTWAIKRPQWFAAVYSDRGRWRGSRAGSVVVPDWTSSLQYIMPASVPNIAPEDGGGSFADWQDGIMHVQNTANKLPWIGVAFARQDQDYPVEDHVAAFAALRARKAGFAAVWNDGGHASGPTTDPIAASYPFGTFQLGKSYPYFSEHSLDGNPLTDPTGGINLGLKFRNVVDTAGGWSCEVAHISTPCTVKVEPCNSVNYKTATTAKLVTITAANTWVSVAFP